MPRFRTLDGGLDDYMGRNRCCYDGTGADIFRNGTLHGMEQNVTCEGTDQDLQGTEPCTLRNRTLHVGTGTDKTRNRTLHVRNGNLHVGFGAEMQTCG